MDDTSTEYETDSDDFPSPRKKDNEKDELKRRIYELEKLIKKR
jgi:hypothetical protein